MKKIKYLFILMLTVSTPWSFAVQIGNMQKVDQAVQIDTNASQMVSNGSGPVKMVHDNFIVIGKKQYTLARNYKVYDGRLKKGSFVRFLLNINHEVQEIWIMK